MTGNAIEEALITKIDHPAHRDPARFAGLAGAAVGMAVCVGFAFSGALALGVMAGVLAGLGVGTLLYRRLEARRLAAQAEAAEARRAAHEEETRAAIRAMQETGR